MPVYVSLFFFLTVYKKISFDENWFFCLNCDSQAKNEDEAENKYKSFAFNDRVCTYCWELNRSLVMLVFVFRIFDSNESRKL